MVPRMVSRHLPSATSNSLLLFPKPVAFRSVLLVHRRARAHIGCSIQEISHIQLHASTTFSPRVGSKHCRSPRIKTFASPVDDASTSSPVAFPARGAHSQERQDALPSASEASFSVAVDARVLAVVGAQAVSPYSSTSWEAVMLQMARHVSWVDPSSQLLVFPDSALDASDPRNPLLAAAAQQAHVVLAVAVSAERSVAPLQTLLAASPSCLSLDSHAGLAGLCRLRGVPVDALTRPQRLAAATGLWADASEALQLVDLVRSCWARGHCNDIWFVVLAIVNACVRPVPALQSLRATGLASLRCMLGNCAPQIAACLLDETCRSALACLGSCGPTDQVCSYRCIVSYESPQLEAFSLCVLQKHNCLFLDAEIRTRPPVAPLAAFRGAPLSFEAAEDVFVGWLGRGAQGGAGSAGGQQGCPWSWRVVAGQNAAYDQFPCQYQIFYRGRARGSMWYDPVFKVRTVQGGLVWRRRYYRVRRGATPGTFLFSVLDNGVTSEEHWCIVDATDDLSWALFYYSGAASKAGQAYTGAVLVSRDGRWPEEAQQQRLTNALEQCGILQWELYQVDNSTCEGAPLGFPAES